MVQGAGPGGRVVGAVGPGAADVVLVLGQVGQLREIAEGADDQDGPARREGLEDALQLLHGRGVAAPAEAHRAAPDLLDELEGGLTLLLPHRIAQQSAQQPDVLHQRQVLIRQRGIHGAILPGGAGGPPA